MMCFVLIFVCISAWAAQLLARIDVVPLNPRCLLSDDIVSMKHDIEERRVEIVFNHERRCSNPSLILRISGTSLYKLDYDGLANDIQVYRYPPMLDAGIYFLEAVVIYCEEYDPERQETQCHEDFHFERAVVTLPYNFSVPGNTVTTPRARWKLEGGTSSLLSTRHQRFPVESSPGQTCKKRYKVKYCEEEEAALSHHLMYAWTDGVEWLPVAEAVRSEFPKFTRPANPRDTTEQSVYICFVGDSHSVQMTAALHNILLETNVPWIKVRTVHRPFSVLVNATSLEHCSVAVMSFLIWHLYISPIPHTPKVHYKEVLEVLDRVAGADTTVFFRSENINGLGVFADQCPGGPDRRSPPAFDALNNATLTACTQRGVPFINLDPIIYPMWDSARDFCHPPHTVFTAETEYILHSVFRHVIATGKVLTTFTSQLPSPPPTGKTGPEKVVEAWNIICSRRACR